MGVHHLANAFHTGPPSSGVEAGMVNDESPTNREGTKSKYRRRNSQGVLGSELVGDKRSSLHAWKGGRWGGHGRRYLAVYHSEFGKRGRFALVSLKTTSLSKGKGKGTFWSRSRKLMSREKRRDRRERQEETNERQDPERKREDIHETG